MESLDNAQLDLKKEGYMGAGNKEHLGQRK